MASGNVSLGGNTLTLPHATDTFSGVIAGSGGIAVNGDTETLSGDTPTQAARPWLATRCPVSPPTALGTGSDSLTLNGGTPQTSGFASSRAITLTAGGGTIDGSSGLTVVR